jgi:hypothetical protein
LRRDEAGGRGVKREVGGRGEEEKKKAIGVSQRPRDWPREGGEIGLIMKPDRRYTNIEAGSDIASF